jgi:hypothetical protein
MDFGIKNKITGRNVPQYFTEALTLIIEPYPLYHTLQGLAKCLIYNQILNAFKIEPDHLPENWIVNFTTK